jgi:hypothetical protein
VPSALLKANRPAEFTETDTVGARWVYRASGEHAPVTAFALCSALPKK